MKRYHLFTGMLKWFAAILLPVVIHAQTPRIEQLKKDLELHPQEDTFRANRLNQLAFELRHIVPAETVALYQQALALSKKINYTIGEAYGLLGLGFYYRFRGQMVQALSYTQEALEQFRQLNDTAQQISCLYNMGYITAGQGETVKCISYSFEALQLAEEAKNEKWIVLVNTQLGNTFLRLRENAKAQMHLNNALKMAESTGDKDGVAHCRNGLGQIAEEAGRWDEAIEQYQKGFLFAIEEKDFADQILFELCKADVYLATKRYDMAFRSAFSSLNVVQQKDFIGYRPWVSSILARSYFEIGKTDSAIYHGLNCLASADDRGPRNSNKMINRLLAKAYFKKGMYKEAVNHQQAYLDYKDSLDENDAVRRIAAIEYTYGIEKKQSEINLLAKNQQLIIERNRQQQKLLWGTGAGILLLCILLFTLWKNNQQKIKANLELKKQQEELKAAQSQLVQSEKMASLGELTAGIAHEIQNPLNFVNNFSDVNKELLAEMKEEIDNGNMEEVKVMAGNIADNEEKINHHGKRAGSIVKSMLQHSRSSTGKKEPTDINALADEYLRLAYHGLRAKDKSFNAKFETALDTSIGKINVVPQDIGRVILNLITNAFYAVNEKKRTAGDVYEPTVTISTKKLNSHVEIRIRDNGNGIPQKVIDKIFQPFFTTKPTGQGTGLGLSMSYDIVTKTHGGQLKAETKEGEYAEFVIILPI